MLISEDKGEDSLPPLWILLKLLFVVSVLSHRPHGHLVETSQGEQKCWGGEGRGGEGRGKGGKGREGRGGEGRRRGRGGEGRGGEGEGEGKGGWEGRGGEGRGGEGRVHQPIIKHTGKPQVLRRQQN